MSSAIGVGSFPHSYQGFVKLMPTALVPLVAYLHTQLGRCSGISFIDSTSFAICRNPRIHQHRVFAGRAARGKTSVVWFFGFKLHLVVNEARTVGLLPDTGQCR